MRTSMVVDDQLLAEAMKLSGARTKHEVVEKGLRLMVELKRREQIDRSGKSGRASRSRHGRGAP